MLRKIEKVGARQVLADGQIQVRMDTEIWEDDERLSVSYWREVIAPGQDVSNKPPEVQRLAKLEHTEAVIQAYIKSRTST